MFESLFSTASLTDTSLSPGNLLIALAAALILGLCQSVIYMKTHKDQTPSQSFAVTLVMLPAIIAIIVLLVGSNIARAFSLAGVFAIIRFRSAPGDPKDIAFVLFTMATGLACGMGFVGYAAIIAAVIGLTLLLLNYVKFGKARTTAKVLKIMIPENLDYQNAFDEVLDKYTLSYNLTKVKTVDLGSLYELFYTVTTKDDIREKDFIDELRCRNGNLAITLVMCAQNNEY